MSDILIKNLKKPIGERKVVLVLQSDGQVSVYEDKHGLVRFTDAIELPENGIAIEELIADYQQTHKCDIDTATYYTMAFLVDAVASGMSSLEGMHKRIFGEANDGSDN